jgi:hypothetical protein
MTRNRISKVRHLAVAILLGNLVLVGLLGVVLPQPALAVLPLFAIMLPLLSAAAIERALSRRDDDREESTPAAATGGARLSLGSALHAT